MRCKENIEMIKKPLHMVRGKMYKQVSKKQPGFKNFYLPFGGKLNPGNRWVKLLALIPWEELEEEYAKNFAESGQGAPAKPFRMALGALLIKEKLRITDEETVEQIRENPYLQYLIGMEGYRDEAAFDPSMTGRRFHLLLVHAALDGSFSQTNQCKDVE